MAAGGTTRKTRRSNRLDIPRHSNGLPVLPAELVTYILGYLPTDNLRCAASVSRLFYACAWDAGLCIHRWLVWGKPMRFNQQLASLNELVQHALPKDLRLSLSFWLFSKPNYDDSMPSHGSDSGYPDLDDILPVISAALPLLVYLSVKVSNVEKVVSVLCRPMPRLRALEIMRTLHERAEPFPLPRDLLSGRAPLLRNLSLANVTLTTAALPAFTNVTTLRFSYDFAPPSFSFSHHFPHVSSLTLKSYADEDAEPGPSQAFNLNGLALRSLTFETAMLPALQRAVALNTIPALRCKNEDLLITWLEPDEQSPADLSLRMVGHFDQHSEVTVIVVPSHRRWHRIYDAGEWFPEHALPLRDELGGTARLTYLRVHGSYLHGFLSCSTACPALKDVQVDLYRYGEQPVNLWPPNSASHVFNGLFRTKHRATAAFDGTESPYDVPCAALEELTLFALDENVAVVAAEVAFLGRALGQLARAKRDRAALAIVGVDFAKPAARTLVELTFSAVRRYAFAGLGSTEDLDDGIWDALDGGTLDAAV